MVTDIGLQSYVDTYASGRETQGSFGSRAEVVEKEKAPLGGMKLCDTNRSCRKVTRY